MTEVIKQQPCQRSGGIITHCRAPGVGENEDVEAKSEKTLFQEKKEGGGETEEERESGRKGGRERGRGKQQHLSPSCRFCGRQPAYGSENLHHLKVGLGKKPTGDLGRQQPTPFLWVP